MSRRKVLGVVYTLHAGRSLEGDAFDEAAQAEVVVRRKRRVGHARHCGRQVKRRRG